MKYEQIDVLDHGFIRLIETWGFGEAGVTEAGIVEAARQSTQGSFRGWEFDRKLLTTLFTSTPPHATPFEFAGAVVEVRAPIFVFREWQRHRTQSYNEMSARYAPLPDVNYVPSFDRLMMGVDTRNKQAGVVKGAAALTMDRALQFQQDVRDDYAAFETAYQEALRDGIPKELARITMPVGRYSQMRASTCLRNWLAFVTLRSDPNAQWEIRQYSEALETILAEHFPETWQLFELTRGRAL